MTSCNAFVYGTLMADEVLTVLISRVPKWRHAKLSGFTRRAIKGQVYPAIISSDTADASVTGKVLQELTLHELRVLDEYEAEEYERITVRPCFEDGTDVEADVYIFREQYRALLEPHAWDYDAFRQRHLPEYVAMTAAFVDDTLPQLLLGDDAPMRSVPQ